MKSPVDTFTLNNGVKIPCIGFGTWQTPDGEAAVNAVKAALAAGYRHIDAAAVYGNEASVGKGIKESGVPRENIFITSKLPNTARGHEQTIAVFEKTLKDLQLDYLDLYLIHWPNPTRFRHDWQRYNAETWKAMEELHKAGKIRAIGLSNFFDHHMDALLEIATVKPAVNQVRLCPGDAKDKLVKASLERGMLLEAYSPLGGTTGTRSSTSITKAPLLLDLEKKYHKSPAQICLRWCLQKGFLPLPKSMTPAHIAANLEIFDFEMTDDDMKALSYLEGYPDPFPHPDETPF